MISFRLAVGVACVALAIAALTRVPQATGHGFAGQRFFPATILTDDPFVADEISLPTTTRPPTGADGSQQIDVDIDLAKRITPDLGFTIGQGWSHLKPKDLPGATGLTGINTGLQYQLFINGPHEVLGLIGLNVSWAHTGRVAALGAPDVTTLSPTFNFGKGFGDLAPELGFVRPFAVTGNLGFDFPTKPESAGTPNPNNFNYGFAFEYSLPYLQCCVKDIGLTAPFNRLIPLVEIGFTTPINRTEGVQTVGTIQPGLIWSGTYFQIGAEAILPVNKASGRGFGGVVQFHVYLDDLFPRSIGKPISEW
jgi:hypothetical protein